MIRNTQTLLLLACFLLLASAEPAFAHGETARGGGSANALNAVGGIISGGGGFGFRLEIRDFEQFTNQQLTDFTLSGEDVHQHSQEISLFVNAQVTLLPDLDLSVVLPFNAFRNFREAELQGGTPVIVQDDFSAGVGDLVLLGRYRVVHEGPHHLALLGGIKIPTGMNRETDNDGERIGTHNQPGSGSVDFQLGAGGCDPWAGQTAC